MKIRAVLLALFASAISFSASFTARVVASADEQMLTVEHYVPVHSMVPAMTGQISEIYVRERLRAGTVLRAASLTDRVVLFVHGAGTPAEVAFDVPYRDYSWMSYLAGAGFDAFAMDMTGYGRSTRPAAMNDPCNLAREQQSLLIPSLLSAPCAPSYAHQMTTIASDWNDIGTVVDYIRALRHVDRVDLVAWSLGGPRAGGYAAQHPEKIGRVVLLAPAYNRTAPATAPAQVPADGAAMGVQGHEQFVAGWDRQVGCPDQYDPAASDSVWSEMIASDPVGATWDTGMRRAPQVTTWGWNNTMVAAMQIPILLVSGEYDKQVPQDRVRDLFADLPSHQKVFVDLGCSSHNAMWEKNRLLLFRASLEWLTQGSVNGTKEGMLRLGYPATDKPQ